MDETTRALSKGNVSLEDGWFFRTRYRKGEILVLDDAKEEIVAYRELSVGKKMPILVDIRPLKSVDREARAHFSGEEAATVISAAALLVGSPVSRVLGNFFIGLNKPSFPTKLFSSETDAIEWLKGLTK